MHINIQCLTNKTSELNFILGEYKPTLLCISEHWVTNTDHMNLINLDNYRIVSSYCRQTRLHGGTAIFCKLSECNRYKNIKFLNDLSIEISFECSAVSYNKNSCVVVLYRSPSGDINIFLSQLTILLEHVSRNYKYIYLCGDLNINKLNKTVENVMLHDLLDSFGLESLMSEPTRIANGRYGITETAIDYLITNVEDTQYEIFDPDISDHTAQLLKNHHINHMEQKAVKNTVHRFFDKNSMQEFKSLFRNTYDNILNFTDVRYIDDLFDVFWGEFIYCFETAFPKRKSKFKNKKKILVFLLFPKR